MSRKSTTIGMWLVGLGMIALFIGAVYGVGQLLGTFWHEPTVAMCNGEPMYHIDKCESVYSDGSRTGTSYTYDQQLSGAKFEHNIYKYGVSFAIVVVLCILGGLLIARHNTKKLPRPNSRTTSD